MGYYSDKKNCHWNYEILQMVPTRMDLGGSYTEWSQQQRKKIAGDMPSRQNLKKKKYRKSSLQHKKILWQSKHKELKKKKTRHEWNRRLILTYTQKAVSVMGNPQGLSPSFLITHLHRNLYISQILHKHLMFTTGKFAWNSARTSRAKQSIKEQICCVLIYVTLNQVAVHWQQAPNGRPTIFPHTIAIRLKKSKA